MLKVGPTSKGFLGGKERIFVIDWGDPTEAYSILLAKNVGQKNGTFNTGMSEPGFLAGVRQD